MELKFYLLISKIVQLWRSNCTFMELKFNNQKAMLDQQAGSNCTFMELKWRIRINQRASWKVLIVPLWN